MTQAVKGLVLAMMLGGLAACATAPMSQSQVDGERQSKFDKGLDSWHGAKVHELIAKLGPPDSTSLQSDGKLVYVYAKSTKLSGPNGPTTFSCVVRYLVDAPTGRIEGHRIEGC